MSTKISTPRIGRSALLGFVGMFAAFAAQAAPIVYSMSGVFDKYHDIKGITDQSTFTASYTFDPGTGTVEFPDAASARYMPFTFSLAVPDLGLSLLHIAPSSGFLDVRNDSLSGPPPGFTQDSFGSQAGAIDSPLPAGIDWLQAQFSLWDSSASALSSRDLPLALDLASFSANMFQLNIKPTWPWPDSRSACDDMAAGGAGDFCTANATITSFSVSSGQAMPEPSSLALLFGSLGLLGLMSRRPLR